MALLTYSSVAYPVRSVCGILAISSVTKVSVAADSPLRVNSVVCAPSESTLKIILPSLSTIFHSLLSETMDSLSSSLNSSIAFCVAVDTGLSISAVLSTLPKPTCSAVTLWGLSISVIWFWSSVFVAKSVGISVKSL